MKLLSSLAESYFGTLASIILIALFSIAALVWYALRNNELVKTTFFCRYFGFSLETRNTHRRMLGRSNAGSPRNRRHR
jgi:hypothetical protein